MAEKESHVPEHYCRCGSGEKVLDPDECCSQCYYEPMKNLYPDLDSPRMKELLEGK